MSPLMQANPDAQVPSSDPVRAGEYLMRFARILDGNPECLQGKPNEKTGKQSWYTRFHLLHAAPKQDLIRMAEDGQPERPFKDSESPGRIIMRFMMDPDLQGTLRQAYEAIGGVWADVKEFDENWILQTFDTREVAVKLKCRQYQGRWSNEVDRFLVPEKAA